MRLSANKVFPTCPDAARTVGHARERVGTGTWVVGRGARQRLPTQLGRGFRYTGAVMNSLDIPYIICCVLAFIPAIVLHEVGHGVAANLLGDPTAKMAGRLSLNPLRHVDPFGTVLLPAILMLMGGPVFGFAKPVPYNPRFFKNPKVGDLVVGLAGPFTNLLQALLGAAIAWALVLGFGGASYLSLAMSSNNLLYYVFQFLMLFVLYNLYLMMFNLIPIPPLDGSSILALLVPNKYLGTYYRIQQYALPIFFIVVIAVPYVTGIDPVSMYLRATAGNLFNLLLSF